MTYHVCGTPWGCYFLPRVSRQWGGMVVRLVLVRLAIETNDDIATVGRGALSREFPFYTPG